MLARQIAIGFGIAVIFPLLIYYGVATFYPPPKTTDYFRELTPPTPSATAEERKEYVEHQRKARDAYNTAARAFSRVLVIIATPIGVAAILIGAFLSIHAIGTGLILRGIASVAFGYFGYWPYLDDWARFISLLAGFAILLFVGFRRITGRSVTPSSQ
jgi:uncharacterized membrane protein YphA (DoxX/SURF4 family)